jgi:LysM repeat protein
LYNYSSIITHKVSPGQTLSHISDKYNISVKDIKEFNELRSDRIIIGDTLDIPK